MRRDMRVLARRLRKNALVRVFVPSCDRHGRPLAVAGLLSNIEAALLRLAGGATVFEASGAWRGKSGHWTREPVHVLEAYLSARVSNQVRQTFLLELERWCLMSRQEAVLIVINGWPFLLGRGGRG